MTLHVVSSDFTDQDISVEWKILIRLIENVPFSIACIQVNKQEIKIRIYQYLDENKVIQYSGITFHHFMIEVRKFFLMSSDKIDPWKINTSILRTFELTIFRPFNLWITELSEYREVTGNIILLTLIKGRPINI